MPTNIHGSGRRKILILGGTAEARERAARLVADGHRVITSLAGRTTGPVLPEGEVRIGGFGGPEGLARYLTDNGIDRVVDATHPYAHSISENARLACAATGTPLEQLDRPVWSPEPDDNWIEVTTLEEAAAALPAGARVFLALGRQYLSAFESLRGRHLVVRMVDPPETPLAFASYELILGKPSSDPSKEQGLLETHGITHLVCRNSGGEAGYGKIVAARRLGIPVVMIGR